MTVVIVILLTISVLMFIASMVVFVRNEKVHTYRVALIADIAKRAEAEILVDVTANWRRYYDLFEAVSYSEMLYKFWRPFDWFYRDVDWDTGALVTNDGT